MSIRSLSAAGRGALPVCGRAWMGCGGIMAVSVLGLLAGPLIAGTAEAPVNRRLMMPAQINGQAVQFAVDTGASGFVLYQPAAARLGLNVTPPDPARAAPPGRVLLGQSEPCTITLAGRTTNAALPVMPVPEYLRADEVGLIGWPNLRDNIFLLEAAEGRLTRLERVPDTTGWQKYALVPGSAVLALAIPAADGRQLAVVLDTGSDRGASLVSARWREWAEAHRDAPVTLDAYFMPGVGLQVREEKWAKELLLGSLVLRDLPVQEANLTEDRIGPPGLTMDATLGLGALSRFEIMVDGPGGSAYVRPTAGPPPPYPHNRLGAVFTPRSEQSQDLVATVAAGSPAAQAGLRTGDVLVKIDELDVTRWRTDPAVLPLARFWSRPAGAAMNLTIRRDGEEQQVKVVLRDLLGPAPAATAPSP